MTPIASRKPRHWHWKVLFAMLATAAALAGAQALDPPSAGAVTAEEGVDDALCADWLTGALEQCEAEEEQGIGGGSSGGSSGDDAGSGGDAGDSGGDLDDCADSYGGSSACWEEEPPTGIEDDDSSDGFHTGDECVDYRHCWPDSGDEGDGKTPSGTGGGAQPSGTPPAEGPLNNPEAEAQAKAEDQAAKEWEALQIAKTLVQIEADIERALKRKTMTAEQMRLALGPVRQCIDLRDDINRSRPDLDDDNGLFLRFYRSLRGSERKRLARFQAQWRARCAGGPVPPPNPH